MSRGTWVYRDGRVVEKHLAGPLIARGPRSELPTPMVISDHCEVKSMLDGKIYTSKRGLEKSYREGGVICIGNEKQTPRAPAKPECTIEDVAQAVDMVRQGYKPSIDREPLASTETGWTDYAPEAADING